MDEKGEENTWSRMRPRVEACVRQAPFAGRIGGNQGFVTIGDDEESEAILQKQPDAAPIFSFKDSLDPKGFLVFDTWRQAVVEGWGACLLTFTLGAASSGLTVAGQSPFATTLYAALANSVGLSLFIYAAAPMSGGHLNPTITIATCFAGLCTVPRAVLYITAQAVGAIVGGYWLKLGLGDDYFPTGIIPGCTVTPGLVSVGELFALEYMFSEALIFVAFGIARCRNVSHVEEMRIAARMVSVFTCCALLTVGLDPRQAKVFGPALAPFLVGLSLGLGTLVSALVKPGYFGVSFNASRCLGLMTAKASWQYHWVHWVAPLCAALVNGFFYQLFPPYVRNKPMALRNPTTRVI